MRPQLANMINTEGYTTQNEHLQTPALSAAPALCTAPALYAAPPYITRVEETIRETLVLALNS